MASLAFPGKTLRIPKRTPLFGDVAFCWFGLLERLLTIVVNLISVVIPADSRCEKIV